MRFRRPTLLEIEAAVIAGLSILAFASWMTSWL